MPVALFRCQPTYTHLGLRHIRPVGVFACADFLTSYSDMFRAQGFNREAFANTIQDIYLLRVVLVVFLVIFLTGLLDVGR